MSGGRKRLKPVLWPGRNRKGDRESAQHVEKSELEVHSSGQKKKNNRGRNCEEVFSAKSQKGGVRMSERAGAGHACVEEGPKKDRKQRSTLHHVEKTEP